MARGPNAMHWTDSMIESLIGVAGDLENAVVLRGAQFPGQNTTGETKKVCFERMAATVTPELHARNRADAGKKVGSKYEILCRTYNQKHKLLRATGGGVGQPDAGEAESGNALHQVRLGYYIDTNGPTKNTPPEGVNLWDSIVKSFKWFPQMHKMLCTRPNQVPIAMTTGIGPTGPRTVLHQPPSRESSPDWNLGDLFNSASSRSVNAPNTAFSDDESSSSIFIFPASSPPPPPGPGKGVDPRERGVRSHPTAPKAQLSVVKSEKGIPKAKKPERKTAPRASKHTAELQSSDRTTTNNKRKDRDPFMTFAESFTNRRAKVDSDNAYVAEKRLLLTAAGKYNYSKNEFKRRDRRIDMRYGRINVDDSDSSDDEPPAPRVPSPPPQAPIAGPSCIAPHSVPSGSFPNLPVLSSSPAVELHPFGDPKIPEDTMDFCDVPDDFWLPHTAFPPASSEFAPPDA